VYAHTSTEIVAGCGLRGSIAVTLRESDTNRSSPPGSRPLHVVYVTARYLPERGGTEIHTNEVAHRMSERGARVTVIATSLNPELPEDELDGDVRIRRVRAWPRDRDYFLSRRLPAAIREAQPDLLHIQGYHTLVAPLAMLAALRASIPYVVTFHSGGHSSRVRVWARPLQGQVLRPLLVRARALVSVSQFEADLFTQRLRIPPAAFAVIPSGINLPQAAEPAGSPVPGLVLSVGRLEFYKGHDRIIEALPALRRLHPDARLRVLGSGPYEPQLRQLAAKLGVTDAVEIGPVASGSREELAALLNRAAVVTALSEYESQGLAVQEAIGLGRPVVVAQGSALDELRAYPNVVTVPAGASADAVAAAVSRVLRTPPVAAPQMQTWDACVDALAELYRVSLGRIPGVAPLS
jgi:glycosyltransferase involved in cell wall biosynthesis